MQIRILGPIEVVHGDRVVSLGGPKQRTVLATLALHHGEVVSSDVLIEAAWRDDLPVNSANTLQYQIAQLRKVIEPDPSSPIHLLTRSGGYVLDANTTTLDATDFARYVLDARSAFGDDDFDRAARTIDKALSCWRGPALGEFRYDEFAGADATRLDSERIAAEELFIDIALAQGRHAEVVPTLSQLTIEHPTREGFWARRMIALYRDGNQTDALRVYQQARDVLTEVGIEPSAELRGIEQQILDQDPDLAHHDTDRAHRADSGNLPSPPNQLIGRQGAVEAVADRLATHRLVTLIGPGGAGKTRLALEVARSTEALYTDGAWLVRLDLLDTPDLLASHIGQTLGMRENPEFDIADSLRNHFAGRHVLLVLDNCEHLVDAVAAFVLDILECCANVRVLATSQITLDIQGESVYDVHPLTVPGESASIYDRLDEVAAVALFLDRSRPSSGREGIWTDEELVAVSNIVTALDGVPLAVELAAARTRSMSLDEIAAGLADPMAVLTKGSRTAPTRQQSLAGVVEWSLRLLEPDQGHSLMRLSVFVGGFDTSSAAAVLGLSELEARELLGDLVDRSLLQRMDNVEGAARYRMLETLRQYCMHHLRADDLIAARDDHLDAFRQFTVAACSGIFAQDQLIWLARLDAEYENIRAALAWALDDGPLEIGLQMGADLGRWWDWKGLLREASEWLGRLSEAATTPLPGVSAVRAWHAYLFWEFGDMDRATDLIDQAADAAEAIGDPQEPLAMFSVRALISRSLGDLESARGDCENLASISRTTGDAWAEAWAHSTLATIDLEANDPQSAEWHARTATDTFREIGDARGVGWGLVSLAQTAFSKGDLGSGQRLAWEALAVSRTVMDHRTTSWILELLAEIAIAFGKSDRAAMLLGAAHPLLRQRGLTSSASKRDDLNVVEARLRGDLGDAYSRLFTIGSSDPDSVILEELAIAGADS